MMEGNIPVKRVTVSAAVEIFREEVPRLPIKYPKKETFPACKQCLKERNKNQNFNTRPKGRKKQNRANTPIVIQLKDTLKAAMQLKQKNKKMPLRKQDSSESRDEADVETDNSSDRGDMDCIRANQRRKNVKNLSAFINRMEKAHRKEKCVNLKGNLTVDNSVNEKLVAEYVLNNVTTVQNLRKAYRKKSIVDCDNIDVICNDLNSVESTIEDTEESEISSTTSSSEIQSDSDISNSQDSLIAHEYKTDELQRLAEYTIGCPLFRYDSLHSSCPECQWYYTTTQYHQPSYNHHKHSRAAQSKHHSKTPFHKQGHGKKSSKLAQHNKHVPFSKKTACVEVGETISTSESDIDDRNSETSVEVDTSLYDGSSPTYKDSYNWRRPRKSKQYMDIDFAGTNGKHHKYHFSDSPDLYWDSVYVDLTNTDVSFSVYYHHDLNENQSCSSGSSSYASIASGDASSEQYYSKPYYTVPYYHQYMYCSVYWPLVYSLPMPFCLQPDALLPKTAMVPPEELDNFNASAPPQRQWIPLSRPEQGKPAAIFTVMCYNVLCDKYCTRQQYGYCPSWGLNWEYRKKGIMDEIRTCSADIIGLQEVETDQFFNYFKPELERDGYEGIFSPKSRARTMTEQERKHVDGCAIFYRTSKFSLVKEHLIEFNQLAMANAEGSDEMLNRVMTKDNIGLAALLETREGVFESSGGVPPDGQIKQPLLVTTAHMHWDPEFSDVKLIQTMMLMSELKKVVEDSYHSYRSKNTSPVDCNAIPIILCGDLNSLPESGVIEYLSSGRVSSNHLDFKELGYEACLQTFNCYKDSTQLTHHFRLARAYDDNIMPHTNYTFDFKGIIDYIFFSRSYMNLLGVLGPMDENWFHENKVVGCPHPHIPSDHFSLFVEFEMPVPYLEHNVGSTGQSSGSQGNHRGGGSISSNTVSSRENAPSKLR